MVKSIVWVSSVALLTACQLAPAVGGDPSDLSEVAPQRTPGKCVDAAVDQLGIDMNMQSDPELLDEILRSDMKFVQDNEIAPPFIVDVVASKLAQSQSMATFLGRVRSALIQKHPAVVEFLCAATDKGLLVTDDKGKRYVHRTLHHMFILDDIIKKMFNEVQPMVDVYAHFQQKREEYGISTKLKLKAARDIYRATGRDAFVTAKALTMDLVFKSYGETRERGQLEKREFKERRFRLGLNIAEAVISGFRAGYPDNAFTGEVLMLNPVEKVTVKEQGKAVLYHFDQLWASLYETWNLGFITSKLMNLHLLYPKLLIPQVVAAIPSHFMFNRALALWTAINFYLFHQLDVASNTPGKELVAIDAARQQKLGLLWGQVNAKYASTMLADRNPEVSEAALREALNLIPRRDRTLLGHVELGSAAGKLLQALKRLKEEAGK